MNGLYRFKFRNQESCEKATVAVLERDNGALEREVTVEAERSKWI